MATKVRNVDMIEQILIYFVAHCNDAFFDRSRTCYRPLFLNFQIVTDFLNFFRLIKIQAHKF